MAQMMVPLAICCAAVSSSSLAMQFMGGGLMKPFRDIFNLATNGQNSGERSEASASEYCELNCGDCSQAKYDYLGGSTWVASAAEAEAICKANRSGYSGSQADWDVLMGKFGGACCT